MSEQTGISWTDATSQRFWSKVDQRGADECWPWLGALLNSGYGIFCVAEAGLRNTTAHRFAYLLSGATLGPREQVDHLCRNRACVNRAHLEAVSNQENTQRGLRGRLVTVCRHGHLYTDESTGYQRGPYGPRRLCLICRRARDRARRHG